jgi:hypothetical protein
MNVAGSLRSITEVPTGAPGTTTTDPPSPRTAFLTFLSRSADGVFLVGGQDAHSQQTLHDIWFLRLNQDWAQLPLTTGDARAATYSFADRRLWLVDHVAGVSPADATRVTRVDPNTGASEDFLLVPDFDAGHQEFLAVDRDGSILLSVSSSSPPVGTYTARISLAGGAPVVSLIEFENGLLSRPVVVDDYGYSFVFAHEDGTIEIKRRSDLEGIPCQEPHPHGPPHDGVHHEGADAECLTDRLRSLL